MEAGGANGWWDEATRLRQSLTKLLFTTTVGRARLRDFTSIIVSGGAVAGRRRANFIHQRNSALSNPSVAAAGSAGVYTPAAERHSTWRPFYHSLSLSLSLFLSIFFLRFLIASSLYFAVARSAPSLATASRQLYCDDRACMPPLPNAGGLLPGSIFFRWRGKAEMESAGANEILSRVRIFGDFKVVG